jgi:SnoaL-like domain
MTLEELLEVEAIKRVKYRYFRYVDTKRWDDWGALLTEDAVLDHPANRPRPIVGRDAIVAAIRDGLADVVTVHHGHSPEIDLIGADRAHGVWAMEDLWLAPAPGGNGQPMYHGFGHYLEEYVKRDGTWLIARIQISRLHLERRQYSRMLTPELDDEP